MFYCLQFNGFLAERFPRFVPALGLASIKFGMWAEGITVSSDSALPTQAPNELPTFYLTSKQDRVNVNQSLRPMVQF